MSRGSVYYLPRPVLGGGLEAVRRLRAGCIWSFPSPARGCCRGLLSSQRWPAPGSEDTELGVILEPEVVYGTQTLCTRVQA